MLTMLVLSLSEKLAGKSQWIGSLLAMAFGVTTEATGVSHTGNTAVYVALCGFMGAFIASLPKIIAARSNARMSENEFIGAQTRGLIDTLRKNSSDTDRILALSTSVRHDIQDSLQAAYWHIEFLKALIPRDKHKEIPPFTPLDIRSLLREMDNKVLEIKESAA